MTAAPGRSHRVPGVPARVGSLPDLVRATSLAATTYGLRLPTLFATARFRPAGLAAAERREALRLGRGLRIRAAVNGLDDIDTSAQYVVTPLHESLVDPLVLAELPLDLTYAVRSEFLDWFGLGRHLSNRGHVATDPEHRIGSVRHLLEEGSRAVASGESLVVFPQGSILGVEMRFHLAPFRMAVRLGLGILPVVLAGGHRVWEHPFDPRLRFDQPIHLTVLTPRTPPTTQAGADALAGEMRSLVLAQTDAPVRRYVPGRDGFWDGYAFEVDPAFPELRQKIRAHRLAHPRPPHPR